VPATVPADAAPGTGPASAPVTAPARRPAGPAKNGDIDGDGRADQVTLSAGGTLRVRYSGGGTDTVALGTGSPGDQAVLGVVDADGDGFGEVFVRTVQGAAFEGDAILRRVDGHLRMVVNEQVRGTALSHGGSVANQAFWDCYPRDHRIVQWTSTSRDGDRTFQGEVAGYILAGDHMVIVSRQKYSITADQDPPASSRPGSCRSLHPNR
jgi:hypothetical protein